MNLAYLGGCCAIQEIRQLRQSATPEAAMVDFCKALWHSQHYDYRTGTYKTSNNLGRRLDAHYIFTGVEGYSKPDRYGGRAKYGSEFAAFITANDLGTVVGTDPALNRMNHPTHKVAAWIWTPAPTKLKNWWKKYQKEHKNG